MNQIIVSFYKDAFSSLHCAISKGNVNKGKTKNWHLGKRRYVYNKDGR